MLPTLQKQFLKPPEDSMKSVQWHPMLNKFALLCLLAGVSVTSVIAAPESASAYHKTNKWEVRQNLENGWITVYSKEFSHAEYMKLATAIAADVVGGSGSVTAAYFQDFAISSLQQVINQVGSKAPQVVPALKRDLTLNKLLSAIKTSFNGRQVEMSVAGVNLQVGRATYNRAECLKIFGKEKCTSTPNTYQPYIRFRL
jgi:hypothetical protein